MEIFFFIALGFGSIILMIWILATMGIMIASIRPVDTKNDQLDVFYHN